MVQMTGSVRCLDMRALCDAVSILEGDPHNPIYRPCILAALIWTNPHSSGIQVVGMVRNLQGWICGPRPVVLGSLTSLVQIVSETEQECSRLGEFFKPLAPFF